MSDKVITLTLPPVFAQLYEYVRHHHPSDIDTINQPILALDPGETTGFAIFDGDSTIIVSQYETKQIGQSYDWLVDLIEAGILIDGNCFPYDSTLQHIRCEDYRVYEWKATDHSWSPVHTIRWIGAIQVAAHKTGTPLSFCMAQHAKAWWTDGKLNHFGINPKGLKHGRDALRHLLYYILFPTKNS